MKDDLFLQIYNKIMKIGLTKWVLLGIAGVLLIASSYLKKNDENIVEARDGKYEENNTLNQKYEYKEQIEKEVEELIKNIKGVNKTKVMVTLKSSEERVVKEDNEIVVENDERETDKNRKESRKSNTVIVDGENGEQPYVVKELTPKIEGVAVCIKGKFDSEIKNNIIGIIQALFDIEPHKISVTEMKW